MKVKLVDEYNAGGHLIYLADFPGAYVRGRTREEALLKIPVEVGQYSRWAGIPLPEDALQPEIVQEKPSELKISDADSDVIFDTEKSLLTSEKYERLKALTLKSARDFLALYRSIPDKQSTVLPHRETFYGKVPVTAEEMYRHTKSVNSYYFAEIGVEDSNEPDILSCRIQGFEQLEKQPDFLKNTVYDGSYGETWSLKKVFRRFLWHDRIHAKAMYRMAVRLCGQSEISNPFMFEL